MHLLACYASGRVAGLQNRQWIATLFQRASRYANAVGGIEPRPNFLAFHASCQQIAVGCNRFGYVLSRLVQQFNAVVTNATSHKRGHNFRCTLGYGVVERVATTDVSRERVLDADPVSQFHNMVVAGPPTVGFVRAR